MTSVAEEHLVANAQAAVELGDVGMRESEERLFEATTRGVVLSS